MEYFSKHQNSERHETAATFEITSKSCGDIVEMTEENMKSKRLKQRKYFLKIMRSVKCLARQGIPLQGHGEDGNFKQLVMLLSSQREFEIMATLAK